MGGGGRRLPRLTLLAVAVGEQAEDLCRRIEPVEPQGEADADTHRQALAERAGGDLDAGGAGHVGVSLQRRPDLAQTHQLLQREVPVVSERGVLDRRRVPLAEDEPVALGPLRILGIVPEHPVLARDKVCYVGQPVAVVVAQDRYIAKDALDLLRVEYDPLPPLVDPVAAAQDSATPLHATFGTNVAMRICVGPGLPQHQWSVEPWSPTMSRPSSG